MHNHEEYYEQSVEAFAHKMIDQLKANSHKGVWDDCPVDFLLKNILKKTEELADSLVNQDKEVTYINCADLANFAMMIAENIRKK